jgi:hypothetical protein
MLAQMPNQRVLSDRVKTAIKTALATVLAYGVALSMDWEHAYWTALSRQTEPIDRTVTTDQRHCFAVADDSIILNPA